jgi:hypothetical protein
VRIGFLPLILLPLAGCSTSSLETTVTSAGESITGTAGRVWHGAGRLWPAGLWPDGVWVADYERAEELAAESRQGILYLYTALDRTRPDDLRDHLADPTRRGVASGYLPALLFQRNENDRRYAAQFGVQRAPAVIVVHPDGTYHSTHGRLSPESATQFLSQSSPPGAAPDWNPLIARRIGYAWHRDWAPAQAASQRTGRPIFVVLERWMSRDWDQLGPMLERREVQTRTVGMIPCRPSTMWSSSAGVAAKLGVTKWPAVAIVPVEGEAMILEMPNSYEAIVRFIDRSAGRTAGAAP